MLPICALTLYPLPYSIVLCHTCVHYVCTMRNPRPLMSSPNPNSYSRLFPILLDPKSFQTALDSMTSRSHVYLLILCPL